LKGLRFACSSVIDLSFLSGFPLDRYRIPDILNSELISTIDHLREEKVLFTPDYFQEKKIPKVLSKILSEEIQKLGESEGSQQDPGAQDGNESQNNLTSAGSSIPIPATAPAATLNPEVTHATVIAPPANATSGAPATLDLDGNKGLPPPLEPPKLSSNRIDPSRGDLLSTSPDCTVVPIEPVGTTQLEASATPPVSPVLNSPHHLSLAQTASLLTPKWVTTAAVSSFSCALSLENRSLLPLSLHLLSMPMSMRMLKSRRARRITQDYIEG
jgi:hypothetical protein